VKLVACACAAYANKLNDATLLENSDGDEMLAVALKDLVGSPEYIATAADVEAYVLRFPGNTVIAFRGTDSLRDVCEDTLFALCEFSAGSKAKVHEGIYSQYRSVEKECIEIVNAAKAEGIAVTCTGHSSGAALTCFLATATGTNYVGFGAPKVGNADFCALHAEMCKGKVSCLYINGSDPVPKLPLGSCYVHPASIVKVGPVDRFPFFPTLGGIYYHASANYYKAVSDQQPSKPGILVHLGALWLNVTQFIGFIFNACTGSK
jgi:hypothetical protein